MNMTIKVDADAPTDIPEPACAGNENNSGEEFEVNDIDLEENDSILKCLTGYCF